ncbi:MAG: coproporphyrinogen III oxidase, partial [Litorimonas sp.]
DYVGVGPGAHGRLWTEEGRVATETVRRPAAYVEAVAERGTGIEKREVLGPDEAAEEYVLMGLRVEDGLSLARLEAIRGAALAIDPGLVEAGLLEVAEGRLRATAEGGMVLDGLTRALLVG